MRVTGFVETEHERKKQGVLLDNDKDSYVKSHRSKQARDRGDDSQTFQRRSGAILPPGIDLGFQCKWCGCHLCTVPFCCLHVAALKGLDGIVASLLD